MSDTRSSDLGTGATGTRPRPTRWVGLIVFAGIIMLMQGLFQVLAGLAALFNDDYFTVGPDGLPLDVNYTVWGWGHLLLGVLIFLAGIGVMSGNPFARMVGVILAVLNGVVALAFSAAAPGWAIVVITLDVLIIYALTVHGGEMSEV
jgi:hypothetical protein